MSLGLKRCEAAATAAADGATEGADADGKNACCVFDCQFCNAAKDVGLVLKSARSVVRLSLGGVLVDICDTSLSGDDVGELRRFLRWIAMAFVINTIAYQ